MRDKIRLAEFTEKYLPDKVGSTGLTPYQRELLEAMERNPKGKLIIYTSVRSGRKTLHKIFQEHNKKARKNV